MTLTVNKGCDCIRDYESTAAIEIGIESLVCTELCEDIDTADQEVGYKEGSNQSSSGYKGRTFSRCRKQCCRKQGHKVKICSPQTSPYPSLTKAIY